MRAKVYSKKQGKRKPREIVVPLTPEEKQLEQIYLKVDPRYREKLKGSNLRILRKKAGLTQKEFAKRLFSPQLAKKLIAAERGKYPRLGEKALGAIEIKALEFEKIFWALGLSKLQLQELDKKENFESGIIKLAKFLPWTLYEQEERLAPISWICARKAFNKAVR